MPVTKEQEPIAGYKLIQRIGAGGYGEVWSCEAPGGLKKAIKLVYGFLDEDRASRELKALERIKTVNHPFMLSLERIEVVDSQLLVVTELAECSLKDRFEACRREGMPGLDRKELLAYIRDAADALDYMSTEHGLQHLDVKPENLLLLSRHVKVADFGLVKNLHEGTASMMGGLTPLYAPPEVFSGTPTATSDQYSLAIVFMEMLTGTLPFPGRTAVQLATQHQNSRPQLGCLSSADQKVIARGLSKDPSARYGSCRELVEQLEEQNSSRSSAHATKGDTASVTAALSDTDLQKLKSESNPAITQIPGAAPQQSELPTQCRTGVAPKRESKAERLSAEANTKSLPPAIKPADVVDAPPRTSDASALRPTLVLTVGGQSGWVAARLHQLVQERRAKDTQTRWMSILAIDTDSKSLSQVTSPDVGLPADDALTLRLRKPNEYRNRSANLLRWMSRRWLYNIPKSLTTEGLRPLGRLALVDHATELQEAIRNRLTEILGEEAQEDLRVRLNGTDPELSPRVVLIHSLTGGTGGMAVDLAAMARATMESFGIRDGQVDCIGSHWTQRQGEAGDLARANSLCSLAEQNHCQHGYPGDSAINLPETTSPLYDHTYLLDWGDGVQNAELQDRCRELAEFVYLGTASTAAGTVLTAASRSDHALPGSGRVRTVGLSWICKLSDDSLADGSRLLSRKLIDLWRDGNDARRELHLPRFVDTRETTDATLSSQIQAMVADEIGSRKLDVKSLEEWIVNLAERELGHNHQDFLGNLYNECRQDNDPVAHVQTFFARFEEFVEPSEATVRTTLVKQISGPALARGEEIGKEIAAWSFAQLDNSISKLAVARICADSFAAHFASIDATAAKHYAHFESQVTGANNELAVPMAEPKKYRKKLADRKWLESQMVAWAAGRWQMVIWRAVRQICQNAIRRIESVVNEAKELRRELRFVADQFNVSDLEGFAAGGAEPSQPVEYVLETQLEELTAQLSARLDAVFFEPLGGFRVIRHQQQRLYNEVPKLLEEMATQAITEAVRNLDVGGQVQQDSTFNDAVSSAQPRLLRHGGTRRVTLVAPPSTNLGTIVSALEAEQMQPAQCVDPNVPTCICVEGDDIPLATAARMLVGDRKELGELARRLHTRSDVQWRSW
jgi:serine/threonine protein kinase